MDPNSISLDSMSKNFEYERVSRLVDNMEMDDLKNISKYFCKMYLKQQEVITSLMNVEI
jgi:hypothetical protein